MPLLILNGFEYVTQVGNDPYAIPLRADTSKHRFTNDVQISIGDAHSGYAVKPGADRSLFDASGFKEGDIAIALNQQDFTDPRAMIALMRQLPSMDSIQLTVLRKGARHDISIALR